jgi:hypothetical protein
MPSQADHVFGNTHSTARLPRRRDLGALGRGIGRPGPPHGLKAPLAVEEIDQRFAGEFWLPSEGTRRRGEVRREPIGKLSGLTAPRRWR